MRFSILHVSPYHALGQGSSRIWRQSLAIIFYKSVNDRTRQVRENLKPRPYYCMMWIVLMRNKHCCHCAILTGAGSCTALLGFCCRPSARLSTIRRRRIVAGTVSWLGSTTTSDRTGTPGAPVRPTTVHWNWKVMGKILKLANINLKTFVPRAKCIAGRRINILRSKVSLAECGKGFKFKAGCKIREMFEAGYGIRSFLWLL